MENIVNLMTMPNFFKTPCRLHMKFFAPLKLVCAFWMLVFISACDTQTTAKSGGKVVRITDGDTFTMLTTSNQQVKVRLHGIDCPERAQDYGSVARQGLSDLIFGQVVRIDKRDVDRYGRTIAVVYNNKNQNVNEQLLRRGLAWHYKEYDQNPAWDDLQLLAQREKKGLWAQPNPTPPWAWRKRKRDTAE